MGQGNEKMSRGNEKLSRGNGNGLVQEHANGRGREDASLLRGVVAGVAGGLAASWVMNMFLAGVTKTTEAVKQHQHPERQKQQDQQEGEDSTQKVADAVTHTVTGHHLSKEQKKTGGPIVHYAFGGLMGGLYGGIAEYSRPSRVGFGTLFGSALFLGADEIGVPAVGLAKPPTQQPASDQASHWAAHVVYGATVELVRRGMRRML